MREKSMETVTISKAEYEQMQAHITELEKQVELLMEAIRLSRQKRFGASSEKINGDGMEQLSLLFNEAEVYADTEEQSAKEEEVPVAAHKRRKKHEYTLDELPENVPVEVVEHRLPEEERVCPECGETMEEIGKEVTRRLKLIPARAVVQEDTAHSFYELNKKERDRYAGGKDTAGESGHTGQFCHAGGDRPVHGAEIHDGRTAVPPGAGIEASRYPS